MIPMRMEEVASAVSGRLVGIAPDVVVEHVVTDSRDVAGKPGPTLFVARRGEQQDGHDFAAAAVGAGAVAVLAERELEGLPSVLAADTDAALTQLAAAARQRLDATVVAITGSVGKTTTKDLTAAACGAGGPVVAAQGSYNNEVGVPLTVLRADPRTRTLVAELGARGPGQIAALASWVRPDISVVTAVAGVHLELFGTVEAIARTKGELVEALGPDGTAVLNGDDPRVAAMADRCRGQVLRCSAEGLPSADLRAEQVTLDRLARACFVAATPWGRYDVRLPIAGRHNVGNALFALAAAGAADVDVEGAAAAVETAPVSDWRGQIHEVGDAVILNDAYNANPTSTIAALETLAALEVTGRRIAVLGLMAEIGTDHEREHRRVGEEAAAVVDELVVVGGDATGIAVGARQAGLPEKAIVEVATAQDAVTHIGTLQPGDALLVKASRVAALDEVASRLMGSRTEPAP